MSSQIADELLVTIRFRSAKTVIKMNDREHNSQLRAKFQQHSKQRDRICAARNGHANAVSGAEKKTVSVPFQKGVTKAELHDLPEGDWHWFAELSVPGEDKAVKVESSAGRDFAVYRGVTEPIAMALAGPYLFAFEVVSVLLLAALVGAAFLARKEVKE